VISRRRFLATGGAAIFTSPAFVDAQQSAKIWRIAYLAFGSPDTANHLIEAFRQGLHALGYTEGKNARLELRFALGKPERLPDLANELVALRPDVILVSASPSARALLQATTTIPIVGIVLDPVASGLAKNLARPGGNFTGLSNIGVDTAPKLLELLRTVIPKLSRVPVLYTSFNPGHPSTLRSLQTAAKTIGVDVVPIEASTAASIDEAFTRMARENFKTVIVPVDAFYFLQRGHIAALAIKHRIASVNGFREMVEAGGLMSYGHNNAEQFRSAATYVDKILKGAKPGDLPIEQTSTFELVINRASREG
jgi:putative ABC transport system substrate-binding protein